MEGIVVRPAALSRPLSELSVRSPGSVAEMFAKAAARNESAVAVRSPQGDMSYAELEAHSRHLAEVVHRLGLPPGSVVGVDGQGPGGVTALLGVLRAGSALLTLDPALPPGRRAGMLDEAGALAHVVRSVGEDWQIRTRRTVDEPFGVPSRVRGGAPIGDRLQPPDEESPAYVFFTSGSSGVPRPVIGRHLALSHFVSWQRDTFGFGPTDRVAQITNWSFDVVLREILTPLTSGAMLCLPAGGGMDGSRLFAFTRDCGATVLHLVPSLASRWLQDPMAADPRIPSLRMAFFAGESLRSELVRQWRDRVNDCTVINLYGPTETTLAKFFYEVPRDGFADVQPVGRPLPGTAVAILHREEWAECARGEIGEIVIRTPYRSAGYLGAGRVGGFVPNPFGSESSDLVYRTGDLGRLDEDGLLWFEGRMDDQVKVRGVKVALSAVERVLRTVEGVAEAVVLDRRDTDTAVGLVAFVVFGDPLASPATKDLRRAVAVALPSGSVPTEIVSMESMPLLPNGKIDRAALRMLMRAEPRVAAPASNAPKQPATVPAPYLDLVIDVCGQVLNEPWIEADADLYDYGLDSLAALEIAARLDLAVDFEVPLGTLFDCMTARELAVRLCELI